MKKVAFNEKAKTMEEEGECYYLTDYLTLYALMDSSFWFEIIDLGRSIEYVEG